MDGRSQQEWLTTETMRQDRFIDTRRVPSNLELHDHDSVKQLTSLKMSSLSNEIFKVTPFQSIHKFKKVT